MKTTTRITVLAAIAAGVINVCALAEPQNEPARPGSPGDKPVPEQPASPATPSRDRDAKPPLHDEKPATPDVPGTPAKPGSPGDKPTPPENPPKGNGGN
jgi:hypothetical protein